ncbi:uncharacterized protein C11orf98 homolog [Coturnix japonica]|uniref:uncharacterized protein C11orf98 homolog n=1 Tax=Coturnix japonica TaxID=93934 RepID=UPI0007780643|nr:uncharacterized protein C11orf98 homolog [Coturnix japonica]
MGIGGKINRPKTELRRKLFKRRRENGKAKRRQKCVPIPVPSAKRRRKLLKRLRHSANGVPKKPQPRDVEMAEAPTQTDQ